MDTHLPDMLRHFSNSAVDFMWAQTCHTGILNVNDLNLFLAAGEQCYKSKPKYMCTVFHSRVKGKSGCTQCQNKQSFIWCDLRVSKYNLQKVKEVTLYKHKFTHAKNCLIK